MPQAQRLSLHQAIVAKARAALRRVRPFHYTGSVGIPGLLETAEPTMRIIASVPVVLVVLLVRPGRCARRLSALLCCGLRALPSLRARLRGLGSLLRRLRTLLLLRTLLCGLRALCRLRTLLLLWTLLCRLRTRDCRPCGLRLRSGPGRR
jgi:hypothetical protein